MSTEQPRETMTTEELAKTSQPKAPEKPLESPEQLTPVEKAFDETKAAPAGEVIPPTEGETPKADK